MEFTGAVTLYLHDAAHNSVNEQTEALPGGGWRYSFYTNEPGVFYLIFGPSQPGTTVDYWFQAFFTEGDGNDTFLTASPLTPGTYIDAGIDFREVDSVDVDYYRFTVPDAGTISVSLTQLTDAANVYLYDAGHALVASNVELGTTDESFDHYAPGAGAYYLKVSGPYDVYASYRLSLAFAEGVGP